MSKQLNGKSNKVNLKESMIKRRKRQPRQSNTTCKRWRQRNKKLTQNSKVRMNMAAKTRRVNTIQSKKIMVPMEMMIKVKVKLNKTKKVRKAKRYKSQRNTRNIDS